MLVANCFMENGWIFERILTVNTFRQHHGSTSSLKFVVEFKHHVSAHLVSKIPEPVHIILISLIE
jgi:hypothetical protein